MTTATVTRLPVCAVTEHSWSLVDVDFEDAAMGGGGVRRFDCVSCGAVRFE